ncbi:TIGR02678 family protein [Micromonospora trifolii]|uniref:TIGR02678 family protein n=1 Tax=Micromonospora trifolii TaxID=2911208 RepID=UPI003CEDAEC2
MTSIEEQDLAARRARAIQELVARPLLDRRAPSFATIATSERWLKEWFARACGWILIVDYRRGLARLRKVTGEVDASFPLRSLRQGGKVFTKRKYVLLCLVAAALGEHGRSRMSLHDIAVAVADLGVRAGVAPYNDLDHKDRQAMVDVLLVLAQLGIVAELDRSGRDYGADRGGNVLYEIDEQRLAQLLVAPMPPARCASWQQMITEERHLRQDADGPSRLATAAAKQRLMRRLLDRPVCYPSDLSTDEVAAMRDGAAELQRWLAEAGMFLEIRADAWMVVNRRSSAPRTLRDGSNVANAALLVLEVIARDPSVDWVSAAHLASAVGELLDEYPWWAKSLRKDPHRVASITTLLSSFDLIRPEAGGWKIMPAAWRWTTSVDPESVSTVPRQPSAAAAGHAQDDLFSQELM